MRRLAIVSAFAVALSTAFIPWAGADPLDDAAQLLYSLEDEVDATAEPVEESAYNQTVIHGECDAHGGKPTKLAGTTYTVTGSGSYTCENSHYRVIVGVEIEVKLAAGWTPIGEQESGEAYNTRSVSATVEANCRPSATALKYRTRAVGLVINRNDLIKHDAGPGATDVSRGVRIHCPIQATDIQP